MWKKRGARYDHASKDRTHFKESLKGVTQLVEEFIFTKDYLISLSHP